MASAVRQGYYSVLRWRHDVARDECRNLAVILVDAEGRFGKIRSAPLSTVSPRLRDQGLLDAMLVGLESQFSGEVKPDLESLKRMRQSLQGSIYITEPEPVAVPDVDAAVNALYRACVAPRLGGARQVTKGVLLDRVMDTLRRQGLEALRGRYVSDFLFDVTIQRPAKRPLVLQVLSFATQRRDWTPVEHDAGHFLYALGKVDASGATVIQPPPDTGTHDAFVSHGRVHRWFEREGVRAVEAEHLSDPANVAALVTSP